MKLRKLIRFARTRMSVYPNIYIPIARFTKGDWVVAKDTDIVIEGYPRSGNSFAEAAFRISQTKEYKIAHHCHAASQILAAHKWGIPCLVILRAPIDCCRSLIMHEEHLFNARAALQEYIIFHEAIVEARAGFVLADFNIVIKNFGSVINRINEKFGTQYNIFDHKADEIQAFETLEKLGQERGTVGTEGQVYSKSRSEKQKLQRSQAIEEARMEFENEELSDLISRAEKIYQELLKTKDL